MKVYIHVGIESLLNTYIIANEKTNEAVIIDPGKITDRIINQIEDNKWKITAILVTKKQEEIINGIKTLLKIYSPRIFIADTELEAKKTVLINGNGSFRTAGFTVTYTNLPGYSTDAIMYKIGNLLFTGFALSAGNIGNTNSSYSRHLLQKNVYEKIISQGDNVIIFPSYGPPTCTEAEAKFNIDTEAEL